MGRWEPGTAERLREAALELFATKGFDQTCAADIAAAAGVTERTFFRHYADKREVIFGGQDFLSEAVATGVQDAPPKATPLELVASALASAAEFFADERRPSSQTRQVVIEANPALQERELLKLAGVATALRDALAARGVPEPTATLAAETGRAVFHVTFQQWIAPGQSRSFAELAASTLAASRRLA